jgi:hypothetical protein
VTRSTRGQCDSSRNRRTACDNVDGAERSTDQPIDRTSRYLVEIWSRFGRYIIEISSDRSEMWSKYGRNVDEINMIEVWSRYGRDMVEICWRYGRNVLKCVETYRDMSKIVQDATAFPHVQLGERACLDRLVAIVTLIRDFVYAITLRYCFAPRAHVATCRSSSCSRSRGQTLSRITILDHSLDWSIN